MNALIIFLANALKKCINSVLGLRNKSRVSQLVFFKENRESTNQITKLQYLSKVASSVMRFCSLTWQFFQRFIVLFLEKTKGLLLHSRIMLRLKGVEIWYLFRYFLNSNHTPKTKSFKSKIVNHMHNSIPYILKEKHFKNLSYKFVGMAVTCLHEKPLFTKKC